VGDFNHDEDRIEAVLRGLEALASRLGRIVTTTLLVLVCVVVLPLLARRFWRASTRRVGGHGPEEDLTLL
jgi:hypothetical protein